MNHFEQFPTIHNELNPVLWENNHLISEVRFALLKIAKEFYNFLDIPISIKDVIISGSQSNYNYNKNSDIDLHLIVDYNEIQWDSDVKVLFDTKRK